MTPKSVLQIPGADDQHELAIELLPNGTYQFTEWTKQAGDEFTGPYTSATHLSGLYETLEAAKADARQMLPWLRDRISN